MQHDDRRWLELPHSPHLSTNIYLEVLSDILQKLGQPKVMVDNQKQNEKTLRRSWILANSICRGHSLKLHKFRSNLDIRKFSFSQRIVNEWNLLTEHVVLSPSLNVFKARLDVHLRDNRGFT